MAERTVTVGSESGLHARPAALFVRAATAAPAKVTIRVGDGKKVDARSMLAVLSLGAKKGTEVTLESTGDGSEEAVATLAELLERNLDEPDAGSGSAGSTAAAAGSAAGSAGSAAGSAGSAAGSAAAGKPASSAAG